jgi:hypothetical protein
VVYNQIMRLKIKQNLTSQNIKPSKGLGQNFLIDKKALHKIIEVADLSKDEIVLEIGPHTRRNVAALARSRVPMLSTPTHPSRL